MGEEKNEEWGKPKLYLDNGTELILDTKLCSALDEVTRLRPNTELVSHYIGIPQKAMECSFSVKISKASYKKMMVGFAIEMAHHEAERLNNWIKEQTLGSRLPRKKKKLCKKALAKIISETTGLPKNIALRNLKVKRK